MDNTQQPRITRHMVPGRCAVPGCEADDVWANNNLCAFHNQLIADIRIWLGFDRLTGEVHASPWYEFRTDFDAERGLYEWLGDTTSASPAKPTPTKPQFGDWTTLGQRNRSQRYAESAMSRRRRRA